LGRRKSFNAGVPLEGSFFGGEFLFGGESGVLVIGILIRPFTVKIC
jgi:hypothetical protein